MNCKHYLIKKKTGENNFYNGLYYCYKCDTYFTENGEEI